MKTNLEIETINERVSPQDNSKRDIERVKQMGQNMGQRTNRKGGGQDIQDEERIIAETKGW